MQPETTLFDESKPRDLHFNTFQKQNQNVVYYLTGKKKST